MTFDEDYKLAEGSAEVLDDHNEGEFNYRLKHITGREFAALNWRDYP